MKTGQTKDGWSFNGAHYALAIIVAALGIFSMASAVEKTPTQTAAYTATR